MKSPFVVLRLVALLVALALAAASATARTLTIGVDMSESNPLVTSPEFASACAKFAHGEISSMQLGDWVVIRRFGKRSADKAAPERIRLTRKVRPAALAAQVAAYIASLPAKTTEPDKQTNILALFELGSFDLQGRERVIVFTDAIEASATMSERAFLSGKPLPKPKEGYLSGVEIVFFGVGQSKDGSLPPRLAESIRARWSDYFKTAGAKFTAITDP